MRLSILQLEPKNYSILDMYTLEQFFIDHLNSQFNAVKIVHFSRKKSEENFINKTFLPGDTEIFLKPVYIYDDKKTKLLYIANSSNHAKIVLETGSDSIRKSIQDNKLFLNYFFLTLNPIPNTAEDSLLSRENLISKIRV